MDLTTTLTDPTFLLVAGISVVAVLLSCVVTINRVTSRREKQVSSDYYKILAKLDEQGWLSRTPRKCLAFAIYFISKKKSRYDLPPALRAQYQETHPMNRFLAEAEARVWLTEQGIRIPGDKKVEPRMQQLINHIELGREYDIDPELWDATTNFARLSREESGSISTLL